MKGKFVLFLFLGVTFSPFLCLNWKHHFVLTKITNLAHCKEYIGGPIETEWVMRTDQNQRIQQAKINKHTLTHTRKLLRMNCMFVQWWHARMYIFTCWRNVYLKISLCIFISIRKPDAVCMYTSFEAVYLQAFINQFTWTESNQSIDTFITCVKIITIDICE